MSPSGAAAYPPEALFAAAAVIDRALMGLPCYGERHADSDVELARAALDAALPFLAAGTPEISDEEFEAAKADVIARFGSVPPSLQDVIDRGGRFSRPVPRDGASLIAAERRRQVEAEGWTPAHDAAHTPGTLTHAAIAYAAHAVGDAGPVGRFGAPEPWPWAGEEFKPGSPVRELTKAGALIAAELDRLLAAGAP